MKKIFSFLLMSAMLLAVGASVASCSDDDENDGIIYEKQVERYVTGYTWNLDFKKQPDFRFYRNRMVSRMGGSGSVASGQLTWAASNYFGTWAVVDSKLITTFTTGPYEGFNSNSILYGSLTIDELRPDCKGIEATDSAGYSHWLSSSEISERFVDYTDASDHDGALVGTWRTTGYASDGTVAYFTMTIGRDGKVRFTAPNINIDNTTSCTTKNGHVTFDLYLTQATRTRSYIYIREKDEIRFYSEENAQQVWTWERVNQ